MAHNPLAQVKRIFEEVKRDTDKATAVALNKSAKTALSKTLSDFRKVYNVKLKDLKNHVELIRATERKQIVRLRFTSQGLGLEYFPNKLKQKGLEFSVKKGTPKVYEGSFFVKVNIAGHKIVMHRTSEKSYPVERMFGGDPSRVMTTEESVDKIATVLYGMFEKNFDNAFNFYLNKK